MTRAACALALSAAVVLVLAGLADAAWAQGSPFGVPRPGNPPPSVPATGIAGWLFAKQAEFYRQFTGLIRASKTNGGAAFDLFAVTFLYGIFHAAGPGHGKAVIASYVVANRETWTRGVVLSLASALLQALVAIALVGVAAALLNLPATTMNGTINVIETVGYALIIVIGLRLLWVKGRGFVDALRGTSHRKETAGTAMTAAHHDHDVHAPPHACHPGHDHAHHAHDHLGHDHLGHGHLGHGDACGRGHAHSPPPAELGGTGGWSRGLAAVVATGSRPCTGAILVLVFAMAQGLFWLGAGATMMMGLGTFLTVAAIATGAVMARATANRLATAGSRHGALAMRGLETAAAALITVFGAMLLCGYLVNERMIGL
jgi:nickel/cobalt exporter